MEHRAQDGPLRPGVRALRHAELPASIPHGLGPGQHTGEVLGAEKGGRSLQPANSGLPAQALGKRARSSSHCAGVVHAHRGFQTWRTIATQRGPTTTATTTSAFGSAHMGGKFRCLRTADAQSHTCACADFKPYNQPSSCHSTWCHTSNICICGSSPRDGHTSTNCCIDPSPTSGSNRSSSNNNSHRNLSANASVAEGRDSCNPSEVCC
mmetsp:Transcript_43982/g.94202  ORF Transcript_43982/g.94202 Transcript_43982/m.94202 type:complete len:209 (-) Transcript_43982:526-1152(-)